MKKALKIFGIIALLLVVIVISLPFIFKGKLVDMTKKEINTMVNAEVKFGDFDLSLFSSFPNLSFEINMLDISGKDQFEGVPFLTVNNAKFDIDIMTVINGEKVKVNEILIDGMKLNALVLKDGTANYDIALASDEPATTTDENSPYNLMLDNYSITNSSIVYDNRSLDMYLKLEGLNHQGTGSFSDLMYALKTKTSAATVDVTYEGTHYLSKADAEIHANIDITDNFTHYELQADSMRVNKLYLQANGTVEKPKDGMEFDIVYSAKKTSLKNLLSLVPDEFLTDLEGMEATGGVKLDGKVFGTYDDANLPGFTVNFNVNNGKIKYPDLPESIDQIETVANIIFPGGSDFDAISIDMNSFNMMIAESPIHGSLHLKNPLTDPLIDMSIDAQLDLEDIEKTIDLEEYKDLKGLITADVDLKGRLSAIEEERYEDFVANGKVILMDLLVKSDSMPDIYVDIASLDFAPQKLDLKNCKIRMGSSDFSLKGEVSNYLAYYLKDDMLRGKFDMVSKRIDLNEFMTEEDEIENNASTEVVAQNEEVALDSTIDMLEVPENIDFVLQSNIGVLLYDKIKMTNVNGLITLNKGEANMENVNMKVLGGSVLLNGKYTTTSGNPKVDFKYKVKNMDVTHTAEVFSTMERFAPLVSKCTGKYSSDLSLTMDLDKNMNPTLTTLIGAGDLTSQKLFVNGFEPLNQLANKLNISRLSKQNIENINFDYEVADGKVIVKPFDVKLDGIATNISGSTGIVGELDYLVKMKVPVSKLGNNVNQYLSGLVGNINSLGLNLSVGQFVNMNFNITGTMTQPKIRVSVVGSEGESIKETIINTVKEEINQVKEEVIDDAKERAREEADKIIAAGEKQAARVKEEAKKLADKVRAEADAAGKKLIDSATNPIAKLAAKKAAEKLNSKADEKANQLLSKANQRADKIILDAKYQADQKLQ